MDFARRLGNKCVRAVHLRVARDALGVGAREHQVDVRALVHVLWQVLMALMSGLGDHETRHAAQPDLFAKRAALQGRIGNRTRVHGIPLLARNRLPIQLLDIAAP